MPDIRATVLRSEQADTYLDIGNLVDAAGNRFVAVGTFEFDPGARRNTNNTWVDVFQYTPTGVIAGVWRVLPQTGYKADAINLSRSGADLIVTVVTHAAVSDKPRGVHVETASIPGVFVTNPQFEQEEGGAGAWQPTGGQEVEVDYDRIDRMIRSALGLVEGQSLKQEFSGRPDGSFRTALEDKAKSAMLELIDKERHPGDPDVEGRYRDVAWLEWERACYRGCLNAIRDAAAGIEREANGNG
jgi:hypothetical protein